nr:hypothetical protein [Tanacetum cinerariifolium]
MYDMVNGKWKTMRPNGARFCGVHANVTCRAQMSGARGEDYFVKALLNYDAESGAKRYKTSRSSSFNMEYRDASINMNFDVGDDEKDDMQAVERPMGMDKIFFEEERGGSIRIVKYE